MFQKNNWGGLTNILWLAEKKWGGLKCRANEGNWAYTSMLTESRDQSIARLRQNASEMGADAVVMMRFDSGSIAGDMQSVVAYGTAVKFID